MPTAKPRHMLTEDEQLSRALAVAARQWPADRDRPTLLLKHLIETGQQALMQEQADELATLDRLAGSLTGAYEPGEVDHLRDEWPE